MGLAASLIAYCKESFSLREYNKTPIIKLLYKAPKANQSP